MVKTTPYHQVLEKAKRIVSAIAVSSAEDERYFSTMNVIYSDKGSRLLVENVRNLMTIDLLGLTQKAWDPTLSVKLWTRQNHSADDSRVKELNENQAAIRKYLK